MLRLIIQGMWQIFLLPGRLLFIGVKIPSLCGVLLHKIIGVGVKLHQGFLKSKQYGNKILTVLNLGATGYTMYVSIEPFLESLLEKRGEKNKANN
jgi:hypothetical protein